MGELKGAEGLSGQGQDRRVAGSSGAEGRAAVPSLRGGPNTLPGREVAPSSGHRSPQGQPGGAAIPPKAQGGEKLGAGRGQGCDQQVGLEHETA